MSSIGETYMKYKEGNNNEAPCGFFIDFACELDCSIKGWRRTHVLVLDYCTCHKIP